MAYTILPAIQPLCFGACLLPQLSAPEVWDLVWGLSQAHLLQYRPGVPRPRALVGGRPVVADSGLLTLEEQLVERKRAKQQESYEQHFLAPKCSHMVLSLDCWVNQVCKTPLSAEVSSNLLETNCLLLAGLGTSELRRPKKQKFFFVFWREEDLAMASRPSFDQRSSM